MSKVSLVYTTFPDEQTAQKICRELVETNFIACANLLPPIRSIYKWQGKLEDSAEVAALLKTTPQALSALEKRYLELHPYETPCFIEIPTGKISQGYESWLLDQLAGSK